MALAKGHKANLKTLVRAAKDGNLSILECQERVSGKVVAVLCAVSFDGHEYTFTPFATMFDGNPYEVLNPPNPEGGFDG